MFYLPLVSGLRFHLPSVIRLGISISMIDSPISLDGVPDWWPMALAYARRTRFAGITFKDILSVLPRAAPQGRATVALRPSDEISILVSSYAGVVGIPIRDSLATILAEMIERDDYFQEIVFLTLQNLEQACIVDFGKSFGYNEFLG